MSVDVNTSSSGGGWYSAGDIGRSIGQNDVVCNCVTFPCECAGEIQCAPGLVWDAASQRCIKRFRAIMTAPRPIIDDSNVTTGLPVMNNMPILNNILSFDLVGWIKGNPIKTGVIVLTIGGIVYFLFIKKK